MSLPDDLPITHVHVDGMLERLDSLTPEQARSVITRLVHEKEAMVSDDKLYPGPPERATHVYEGEPDARQSADPKLPTSRFRPRYRALSVDERNLHDAIKTKATELEALFDQVEIVRRKEGLPSEDRYRALAVTDLERAVMWAVKALTA
jgi:hypothetical protein